MTLAWAARGRFSVGDVSLEYACWGPPPASAPTLVLLHEGLGCVDLWRDFPERLGQATGFGVFAFSRAGYGQSDKAVLPRPMDYMTLEAEQVLPRVLDATGVQRAVLLGHSDGATIATIYAGSVADHRVRGLIVMAPHYFTEDIGLQAISVARQAYDTGDLRDRLAKYHADPDNAFWGWNEAWLSPGFKAWNVTEVIDYVRVPVLAIQGRQDQYGTLAQIEVLEHRCYAPVDSLVLDECRHAPFQDQPDLVLGAIADYCARLERIEAAAPGRP